MTAILISPSEPPLLRAVGTTSSTPEQYGVDVLMAAPWGLVGVQRKEFPGDFMASLYDDRMARLVRKMAPLALKLMVLEGQPTWTSDGVLVADRRPMTLKALRGLTLTALHEFGIGTWWTRDLADTIGFVEYLAEWCSKAHHDSLGRRPAAQGAWMKPGANDWAEFIVQGVEGIGPELARRIVDRFGGAPLRWSVTREELEAVPGLGKKKVDKMLGVIPAKEEEG